MLITFAIFTPFFHFTGLQLVTRPQCGDHLQRAKLLLPLRQPGRHHGARRQSELHLVSVGEGGKLCMECDMMGVWGVNDGVVGRRFFVWGEGKFV